MPQQQHHSHWSESGSPVQAMVPYKVGNEWYIVYGTNTYNLSNPQSDAVLKNYHLVKKQIDLGIAVHGKVIVIPDSEYNAVYLFDASAGQWLMLDGEEGNSLQAFTFGPEQHLCIILQGELIDLQCPTPSELCEHEVVMAQIQNQIAYPGAEIIAVGGDGYRFDGGSQSWYRSPVQYDMFAKAAQES